MTTYPRRYDDRFFANDNRVRKPHTTDIGKLSFSKKEEEEEEALKSELKIENSIKNDP